MKIFVQYLRTAWYNILQNKGYAVFCFAGTALTFIFVVLVIQLVYIFAGNYPPMTNADRIVRLDTFKDAEGNEIRGEIRYTETNAFLESLKDFDHISLYHYNYISVMANGALHPAQTGFVNADFWKVFDFDFRYGRPFTREECAARKPAAIITENMSRSLFNTENGTGKTVTFQGNDYEVTGVVANISYFSNPTETECTVWVPYVFDKFIPNATYKYTMDVLVPPSMPVEAAKEEISKSVRYHFENRNVKADFPPRKIKTLKESTATGERDMFRYGGMTALFLFLLIPALNILSLGSAYTNGRAEEIALRRTFGASRLSSFLQIMTENFLLVAAGSVAGLLMSMPAVRLIQRIVMEGSVMENVSLVGQIDYAVVFAGVLPAMFVFSLLSGGLPAYLISKRNIALVLKGGSK
jgi:ABC-type antimicrobial peptide transport system permease subunit